MYSSSIHLILFVFRCQSGWKWAGTSSSSPLSLSLSKWASYESNSNFRQCDGKFGNVHGQLIMCCQLSKLYRFFLSEKTLYKRGLPYNIVSQLICSVTCHFGYIGLIKLHFLNSHRERNINGGIENTIHPSGMLWAGLTSFKFILKCP